MCTRSHWLKNRSSMCNWVKYNEMCIYNIVVYLDHAHNVDTLPLAEKTLQL